MTKQELMTRLRDHFRQAESRPEGSAVQAAALEAAEELVEDFVAEQRAEAVQWERECEAEMG